jgi:lysozyme
MLHTTLSDAQVNSILTADVAAADADLMPLAWFQRLDPVRQGSMLNMRFNIGLRGLLGFPSMIHYLSLADWANASAQALNSAWASQVGARATRIAQQILTGAWV